MGKQETESMIEIVLQWLIVVVITLIMTVIMFRWMLIEEEREAQEMRLDEAENNSIYEYYGENIVMGIEAKQGLGWDKKVTLSTGEVGFVELECEEEQGEYECKVNEFGLYDVKEVK